MKKRRYICLLIMISFVTLIFASCGDKGGIGDMNKVFFNEYVMDDAKTLEGSITKEYDVNELISFFEGRKANESIGVTTTASVLTFSEVNCKYPVEIIRTGGYSVYRVVQGGYFYVFWINSFATDTSQSSEEPRIYFSAYLTSNVSADVFDSLMPGVSTAEDVYKLDPSFELSLLMSNGIFSYSYLDEQNILQIEYTSQGEINSYNDLVVKEITVISRKDAPSRYSAIISNDLPKNTGDGSVKKDRGRFCVLTKKS